MWRTRNDGQSWEQISLDLTRADPSTMVGPSGGPITLDQTGVETYATIFTIAPSRKEAGTLWVWHRLRVRAGNARCRQDVAERDAGRPATVCPHQPHRGVSARTGHRVPRRQPLPTRRPRTLLLPDGRFREDVEEDRGRDGRRRFRQGYPRRSGAPRPPVRGTREQGVYVSFDGGAGWQSMRLNLPVTPVHDIAATSTDIVLATHGRSFYVLDTIGVLRQLTPAVAGAKRFTSSRRSTPRARPAAAWPSTTTWRRRRTS